MSLGQVATSKIRKWNAQTSYLSGGRVRSRSWTPAEAACPGYPKGSHNPARLWRLRCGFEPPMADCRRCEGQEPFGNSGSAAVSERARAPQAGSLPYRPAGFRSGSRPADRANRAGAFRRRIEQPSRRGWARLDGSDNCTRRSSDLGGGAERHGGRRIFTADRA